NRRILARLKRKIADLISPVVPAKFRAGILLAVPHECSWSQYIKNRSASGPFEFARGLRPRDHARYQRRPHSHGRPPLVRPRARSRKSHIETLKRRSLRWAVRHERLGRGERPARHPSDSAYAGPRAARLRTGAASASDGRHAVFGQHTISHGRAGPIDGAG